jgi:hypothetical protein
MEIEFSAKSVSYTEALDGDIVQISFDEDPSDDPLNPTSKSVSFAINYEFPPCNLNIEWCDGSRYGGGTKVREYTLSKSKLVLWFEDGSCIRVSFSTDSKTFSKIFSLLNNELGETEVS